MPAAVSFALLSEWDSKCTVFHRQISSVCLYIAFQRLHVAQVKTGSFLFDSDLCKRRICRAVEVLVCGRLICSDTVQKGVEMCGLNSQVCKLSIEKNQGFRLSMKGLDFKRFGSPFIPAAMCFPCSTSTNGSKQSNIFGVAVGDRLYQSYSRPW